MKIHGEMHYLWRAVDHEAVVLDSFASKIRARPAALKFMMKLLKRHGRAEVITTDGLRSYTVAMNELGNAEKQEVGRWPNNRVENSHLPLRRPERAMLRFRQMKTLQKFSSVHAAFHNHINHDRQLISREGYTAQRSAAQAEWKTLAGQALRPLPYLRSAATSCRWTDTTRRRAFERPLGPAEPLLRPGHIVHEDSEFEPSISPAPSRTARTARHRSRASGNAI